MARLLLLFAALLSAALTQEAAPGGAATPEASGAAPEVPPAAQEAAAAKVEEAAVPEASQAAPPEAVKVPPSDAAVPPSQPKATEAPPAEPVKAAPVEPPAPATTTAPPPAPATTMPPKPPLQPAAPKAAPPIPTVPPPAPPPPPPVPISDLAQAVRAAASGDALHSLLDTVGHAQSAGAHSESGEAAATLRAAADLHLLSEVSAYAGSFLQKLPPNVKALLTTEDFSVDRMLQAFDVAQRAGVAPEEIEAARTAVFSEIRQRLSRGMATTSSIPGAKLPAKQLEDLAESIYLAQRMSYPVEEVDTARRLFNEQLEADHSTDMEFLERVVSVADLANAKVPHKYRTWTNAMSHLREIAHMEEDRAENLHQLTTVVTKARDVGLPEQEPLLLAVKAKALACSNLVLGNTLASHPDPNSTSRKTAHLEKLLADMERAKSLGATSTSLVQAVSAAQGLAKAELHAVLAKELLDSSEVKYAFHLAEKAGLLESELASHKTLLDGKVKAGLTASTSALLSSNASATTASIERLALTIRAAAELGNDMEADVAAARSLYTQKLENPLGLGSDTELFDTLVDHCDNAGVKPTHQMLQQQGALRRVADASRNEHCEIGRMEPFHQLLTAYRFAKSVDLPAYAPFVDVQTKVQHCAALAVNSSASNKPEGLEVYLSAIETAKEVGVLEFTLTHAVDQARATTSAYLQQAISARPVDANSAFDAFNQARRAGVPWAQIESAAASLANGTKARLRAAHVALGGLSSSPPDVEELANALHVAWKVTDIEPVLREEVLQGTEAYQQKMREAFERGDVSFTQAAVESADLARAKVEPEIRQWLTAAQRLRRAVEDASEQHGARRLLEILQDAPNTQDKALLETKVKEKAKVDLQAATQSGSYETVKAALSVAARAGVPEASLKSARAILGAL